MNSLLTTRAIKRIFKDLEEAQRESLEGVSLCMPNINDPFKLHGNVEIKDGIYTGCLLHIIFQIPEEYPFKPPAVHIAPGLRFDHQFHAHVYSDGYRGNSICTDLTSNFAGHFQAIDELGKPVKSGWTPSYTLTSVLTQLQVFFADPDLPKYCLPKARDIEDLKKHIQEFKYPIKTNDGEKEIIITHCYDNPYPPFKRRQDDLKNKESDDIHDIMIESTSTSPSLGESKAAETQSPLDSQANSTQTQNIQKLVPKDWSAPLKKITKSKNTKKTKTEIVSISMKNGEVEAPNNSFFSHGFESNTETALNILSEKKSLFVDISYKDCVNPNPNLSSIEKEVRSKLICSVSKADIFDSSEPILGYPIDLEKDQFGRFWPTTLTEILSYDSFVYDIQHNHTKLDSYHTTKFISSFGTQYNYLLPVYIDKKHFERGKQHIFNAISIIYAGVQGTKANDFRPEMVLKVLPPILVKTMIHFIKGTIYQSIAGIETYCQIYLLLVKLIDYFPELKHTINKEVENFYKSKEYRHKRNAGDLGEFMIKLSLSKYGIGDTQIMTQVFKEHLNRQVSWALKANRTLGKKTKCPNFLAQYMTATQVSNQFFLLKLEVANLLLNKSVKGDLEKRCGLLNDDVMKLFRDRMNWIKKAMTSDWRVLVTGSGLSRYIPDSETMTQYILQAFHEAIIKGYLFPKNS